MAGNRDRDTVKCRGFKSCWRGHAVSRLGRGKEKKKKKKKIQGFHRKRNTRFPSSSSFPSLPLPPPFCPDVGKIGNESQTVRFSSGTKRNLARTRRLLTKLERKEKSIHIVIDQFLGPDALLRVSLLPIDFRQRRRILYLPPPPSRLFDYRSCHTSGKHRNFLIFVPLGDSNESPFSFFLFAFPLLSPLSSIFRRGWLVEAIFFSQRTLLEEETKFHQFDSWTNRKGPYRFLSIFPLNFLKSSRNLKRKRFEFRSELKPR